MDGAASGKLGPVGIGGELTCCVTIRGRLFV